MIPNQYLFYWTIINYTLDDKYILDEVPVRLTYDSDIERAEEIMLRHTRAVTADAIKETGGEPYVRFEIIPSGVVGRVRYRVRAYERPQISTEIVDRIFREFSSTPGIRFAYIQYSAAFIPESNLPPPPPHPTWIDSRFRV